LRLEGKKGAKLGQLFYGDEVYSLEEVVFRTPSEHTVKGERMALEVQLVHQAIQGDLKRSFIYSILYSEEAGETMPFFNNIDIMNLASIVHPTNPLSYTGKTFSCYMFT
jgi:carbonic anhydrase